MAFNLRDYGTTQKFSDASMTKVVATPAALCLFRNYRQNRIGIGRERKNAFQNGSGVLAYQTIGAGIESYFAKELKYGRD
jgi:hypothetical protein